MIQNLAQNQNGSRNNPAQTGSRPDRSAIVARQTERLKQSLPKGITMGTWTDEAHHRRPHYVRYGVNRVLEAFANEVERNLRVEQILAEKERFGSESLDMAVAQRKKWLAWIQESGATLEEVREVWEKHVATRGVKLTTTEAVNRYLALRIAEDVEIKSNTYRQMKTHLLDWLVGNYGDRPVAEITPEELRHTLTQIRNRTGTGPAAAPTVRSYRKDWNTFFKRCIHEKWIKENPCDYVKPPKIPAKNHKVFSIQDAFRFLKANVDEPVIPRVALEMWGFFRASSAARVIKGEVNFEEKFLVMPSGKHKSGKRKVRTGHSSVLWEWLALATEETWALTERSYSAHKADAFIRAGIKTSNRAVHNILRHSCISYLMAETKNPPLVSYLAQHSQTKMTLDYEGIASERDGKLWALLTPQAVRGTWEDFLKASK